MGNEKKKDSSQSLLNIVLVIICGAIMGLLIYDYINKNEQISKYKAAEQKRTEAMEKQLAKATEEQLTKVDKLATLYRQASFNNAPIHENGEINDKTSNEKDERIQIDIAHNISANLSPIMAKMDKGQDITNDKLDRIMNELIELLEKETQKGTELRKQMKIAINKERQTEAKLQKKLTETQKVVSELNGMVGELKALYISAHEEDSALGDIGRIVNAVPKFVGNTLTLDWWASRDKHRAYNKISKKQNEIMERYEAIGNPAALKRLRVLQRNRKQKTSIQKMRYKKHKKHTMKQTAKRKVTEPELILIQE